MGYPMKGFYLKFKLQLFYTYYSEKKVLKKKNLFLYLPNLCII